MCRPNIQFQQPVRPVSQLTQHDLHAEHAFRYYQCGRVTRELPLRCRYGLSDRRSGGADANIPVLDLMNNEGTPPLTNINGTLGIPPDTDIIGESIADELVAARKSWKSYQEGLPIILPV
jgi:hypothetical protein